MTHLHIGTQEPGEKVVSQEKIDMSKTPREDAVEKIMEAVNAAYDEVESREE